MLDPRDLSRPHPRSASLLPLLFGLVVTATGCPDGDSDSPTSATAGDDSDTSSTSLTASGGEPDGTGADPSETGVTMSTGASATGESLPECGDGNLDPDEECDLGDDNSDEGLCTTACTLPACGDGLVHAGVEECDDGPGNSDDGPCTTACTTAKCGDGLVHAGAEECDLGLENSDEGACTLDCTEARCGDEKVQEGVEECDLGDDPEDDPEVNDDDAYGGCTTQCTPGPRCGDGEVQAEEECDDGEMPDLAKCSKECTVLSRVIFVSSELYKGNLGGVVGADAKCKLLAATAGLLRPEKFRAWLSDGQSSPSGWTLSPKKRYQLPSGKIIANNWAHLASGSLVAPVNQMEDAEVLQEDALSAAWTGTLADGSPTAATCAGWSSDDSGAGGTVGFAVHSDHRWTKLFDQKCSGDARLYCVEVW